jgi:hypothetical protein
VNLCSKFCSTDDDLYIPIFTFLSGISLKERVVFSTFLGGRFAEFSQRRNLGRVLDDGSC